MADDYTNAGKFGLAASSSAASRRDNGSSGWHFSKFIALVLCLGCDLALNSILDYDLFNEQYRGANSGNMDVSNISSLLVPMLHRCYL
jgi:hypothetical protein